MLRRAAVGIARGNLDHMLIDMIAVGVMQVPVVNVVDVVAVAHGRMAAIGPVLMRVIGMVRTGTRGHGWPPCSACKSEHHSGHRLEPPLSLPRRLEPIFAKNA
jgi:hypothetical protein